MTSDLVRSLLACALILAGGMGLLAFLRPIASWRPAAFIGLSWNLGLLALYVVGSILIRFAAFRGTWPWWVGALFFSAAVAAFGLQKTRPRWERRTGSGSPPIARGVILACLVILCLKAILVVSLMIRLPAIDSDAANLDRWVGLAKRLDYDGMRTGAWLHARDKTSPSLIPAYVGGFLSRWRDGLVCLPWFFTWLSILALAWGAVESYTRNSLWAAGAAFLFAAVPLSITHVLRPGFSDLLLAGFVMSAVSVFLRTMYQRKDYSLRSWLLLVLPLLAASLTKNEGLIWMAWIAGTATCFHLNARLQIPWGKILTAAVLAGGIGILFYVSFHDWIRETLISDFRVGLLFRFRQSDRALHMFFRTFFASNGFNLLYWILLGLCLGMFSRIRSAGDRILLLFSLLPFVFVFYFCCFTGNIPATIKGTDTGRLLLPLQAFALPVFLVAWNMRRERVT
jgi:hypothetical protein